MKGIDFPKDENLLVGFLHNEDAGIYRLTDGMAVVSTLDFFTPIIDDPFIYGEIAMANALSDLYAMGSKPITALNIIGYNQKLFPKEVISEILKGGSERLKESGAVLLGGHTIKDKEIFYGASVNGLINPRDIITNAGAKPGDLLILTKPLGTGIITTALKNKKIEIEDAMECIDQMRMLNNTASKIMLKHNAHSATDVTGFGLIGHAIEMADASDVSTVFYYDKIPKDSLAEELVKKGIYPGGSGENLEYFGRNCLISDDLSEAQRAVAFDVQTSGGLLISFAEEDAYNALNELYNNGITKATILGRILDKQEKTIIIER